jgi:glutaryl-CoA dehydrogenase
MGSIAMHGSEAQQAEWLPRLRRWEVIGGFGLTEPEVGSGVARGLTTVCRREGDTWVLDGQKKWIGNATFGDVLVIWARDEATNKVKGFIVRTKRDDGTHRDGFHVETMRGKIAQRTVQNGLITLRGLRVPESDRLQRAESFAATQQVLGMARCGTAWQGVGCATGAFEAALEYARTRTQFGRPIGSFQLVQNQLVRMAGHLTAMIGLALRAARLQDAEGMRDERSALAKQYCAARCREVVGLARELMGGNGILLEYGAARLFADAEAIYSYEGSNEINTLIVGRALTGIGAFV